MITNLGKLFLTDYFHFIFRLVFYSEAVVQRCSGEKVFLDISQNSQENTCTRLLFLIKFIKFIKKRDSGTGFFPVNFVKFLRTLFFTEHLWWLLLFISRKVFYDLGYKQDVLNRYLTHRYLHNLFGKHQYVNTCFKIKELGYLISLFCETFRRNIIWQHN